jgi:hypothetical protein
MRSKWQCKGLKHIKTCLKTILSEQVSRPWSLKSFMSGLRRTSEHARHYSREESFVDTTGKMHSGTIGWPLTLV